MTRPRSAGDDRGLLTRHHDVETAAFLQRFLPEAVLRGGSFDPLSGYTLPDALDDDAFHEHVASLTPAARLALLDRVVDLEWQRVSTEITHAPGAGAAWEGSGLVGGHPAVENGPRSAARRAPEAASASAWTAAPRPPSARRTSRQPRLRLRLQPRQWLAVALVGGWAVATLALSGQWLGASASQASGPAATAVPTLPTPAILLRTGTRLPTAAAITPAPALAATLVPTAVPVDDASSAAAAAPITAASSDPTLAPTAAPTLAPTVQPTVAPTAAPTLAPTTAPTAAPTVVPTSVPTVAPTPLAPPAALPPGASAPAQVLYANSSDGAALHEAAQATSANVLALASSSDDFVVLGPSVQDASGVSLLPVEPLNTRADLRQLLRTTGNARTNGTYYVDSRTVSLVPAAQSDWHSGAAAVVRDDGLAVMQQASLSAPVLATLAIGQSVQVAGPPVTNEGQAWLLVASADATGYVNAQALRLP